MKMIGLLCILMAFGAFQNTYAVSPLNVLRREAHGKKQVVQIATDDFKTIECILRYSLGLLLTFHKEADVQEMEKLADSALQQLHEQLKREEAKGKNKQALEQCYLQAQRELESYLLDNRDELDKLESFALSDVAAGYEKMDEVLEIGATLSKQLRDIVPSCSKSSNVTACVAEQLDSINNSSNNSVESFVELTYEVADSVQKYVDNVAQSVIALQSRVGDKVPEKVHALQAQASDCMERA